MITSPLTEETRRLVDKILRSAGFDPSEYRLAVVSSSSKGEDGEAVVALGADVARRLKKSTQVDLELPSPVTLLRGSTKNIRQAIRLLSDLRINRRTE